MLEIFPLISPTLNYQPGDISKLPVHFPRNLKEQSTITVGKLIDLAKEDWNSYETSWDFDRPKLLDNAGELVSVKYSYQRVRNQWQEMTQSMLKLEEKNNLLLVENMQRN